MLKRLGLVVVALTLVLAACGGGGGAAMSAEEKAKVAEIKAELLEDTSAENPFADEAAANCFAEGIVSEFGLQRVNELDSGMGVEAGFENMTADEQNKVADLALDCVDFEKIIKEQMLEAGLPEAQAKCVSDALNKDMLKGLFLAEISGEDPSQSAELMGVIMKCLVP